MGTADLTPIESLALRFARFVNQTSWTKSASTWLSVRMGQPWMTLVSANRMHLVGIQAMSELKPDRGILLASNHRSYFDGYMTLTYLVRHTDYCRRFFFPVRSKFYYDTIAGIAVNAAVGAMSMYPPIFRDRSKRHRTYAGLDFLATELARPGTVVGIHPEGKRGTGDDPYELLPPEPGFGRVVLKAKPLVIPIFINGMENDFLTECRSTLDGTGKPIIMVFGAPIGLREFADASSTRLRTQRDVGRKVLDAIRNLGRIERKVRAALERGESTQDALADFGPKGSALLQVRSLGRGGKGSKAPVVR